MCDLFSFRVPPPPPKRAESTVDKHSELRVRQFHIVPGQHCWPTPTSLDVCVVICYTLVHTRMHARAHTHTRIIA